MKHYKRTHSDDCIICFRLDRLEAKLVDRARGARKRKWQLECLKVVADVYRARRLHASGCSSRQGSKAA